MVPSGRCDGGARMGTTVPTRQRLLGGGLAVGGSGRQADHVADQRRDRAAARVDHAQLERVHALAAERDRAGRGSVPSLSGKVMVASVAATAWVGRCTSGRKAISPVSVVPFIEASRADRFGIDPCSTGHHAAAGRGVGHVHGGPHPAVRR